MHVYIVSFMAFWAHNSNRFPPDCGLANKKTSGVKGQKVCLTYYMHSQQMGMGLRSWNLLSSENIIDLEHLEEKQGCNLVFVIATMQRLG
jgi:hypothetical protein